MSNLKIIINNISLLKPVLFINDKQVKIKKESGRLVAYADCDSTANIKIFNYHPLNYPFGILISYFFFLISIMGILDKRYSSKSRRVIFEATVEVNNSTELAIKYEPFHMDKEFVTYTCIDSVQVIENRCFIDQELQKKIRILFLLKMLSWVVLFLSIIIVVIKMIF